MELPFTNPFRKTTSVGYNARTKVSFNHKKQHPLPTESNNHWLCIRQELYTWDKGNQLTYPIKSVDIGYNTPELDITNNGLIQENIVEDFERV